MWTRRGEGGRGDVSGCPHGHFSLKRCRRIMVMTIESLIILPLVQLWLEDAVNRIWLKAKACVFLCAKTFVIGDKVDLKLHYIELEYFRGVFFAPFVPLDRGRGYVECPCLSTRGGEGVKIGSKLVHVVVEWPLIQIIKCFYFLFQPLIRG